ncbi:hypothetical protein GC173_15875 [bacterium]|nr:hypothetical protein [bacterium]
MGNSTQNSGKSVLTIIGGLVLGIGAGFFFFPVSVFGTPSVFAFTGCILVGFGIGLMLTAVRSEGAGVS